MVENELPMVTVTTALFYGFHSYGSTLIDSIMLAFSIRCFVKVAILLMKNVDF